jgi:hypothetical protein
MMKIANKNKDKKEGERETLEERGCGIQTQIIMFKGYRCFNCNCIVNLCVWYKQKDKVVNC